MPDPHPHVLIVEDEKSLRNMLRRFLTLNDYEVHFAADFNEALNSLFDHSHFDVILLDVNFPGGTGLDLLPFIQKHCPDTPVIMVSAEHDADLIQSTLEHGAREFIQKPFSLEVLLGRMEHHMHQAS
ncbi:response regulator [Deinococcus roseus]|nr:response regulator [Deinococcus roseus]